MKGSCSEPDSPTILEDLVLKKPQALIGLLAALGTALGVMIAVIGLPYGRLSYTAFAEVYHGTSNEAGKVHVALDCDLTTPAVTDAVCNFPALGVNTAEVVGFMAGNNTGSTYSVASIGFDVINDNQTQLTADAASSPPEDSNPDLANSAGEAFFGSSVGCGTSPPNPDTNVSPLITDSKLTCFTGGIDGANVPSSPIHTKLASIKYHYNTSVAGTANLSLAKVALGDDGGNEVGTCNPGVDFPMDCFGTVINFFVPPTPTATNTLAATNTPTNTATKTPTNTPTNTATSTPTNTPVPGGQVNKKCETIGVTTATPVGLNNNNSIPACNLFLCNPNPLATPAVTCSGPNEGDLRVVEFASGVVTDPANPVAGLGAYEFQVEYDNFVIKSVNPCDIVFGDFPQISGVGAGRPRGPVDELASSAINGDCNPEAGQPGTSNGTCTMSFVLENIIRFGCVTRGQIAGPQGSFALASLDLIPHGDLANDIFPGNNNGVVTIIKDNGCELVDIYGHPVLGSINGGLTPVCGDLAVTVRILEGDLNLDCKVTVADEQAIASRYGGFFGSLLYSKWFDLEPATHDLDIDIKDLQKVFGRDGSTCQNPIPAQLPLGPPAPFSN